MSKPSITRFLLPSIFVASLLSLGISIFQLTRPKPPIIKYVNIERVWTPLEKEVNKTIGEMMKVPMQQLQVLGEQINSLEQKKKVKNYLGTAEAKDLKEKRERYQELQKNLYTKYNKKRQEMVKSKLDTIKKVKNNIAKKNKCTIQPLIGNELTEPAICKKDDVTDMFLVELNISEEKKA